MTLYGATVYSFFDLSLHKMMMWLVKPFLKQLHEQGGNHCCISYSTYIRNRLLIFANRDVHTKLFIIKARLLQERS